MLGIQEMGLSQFKDVTRGTSKELVFQLSHELWSNDKSTGADIYAEWCRRLFKILDYQQFTTTDWIKLIRSFKDIVRHIVTSLSAENVSEVMRRWLEDSMEFLKFLQKALPSLNSAASCCAILGFFAETVRAFMNVCEKWKTQQDLKSQMSVCSAFYNALLGVVADRSDQLRASDDVGFKYLMKLSEALCDVGERGSHVFDLKTSIETWKCAVRLATHCTGQLGGDKAKELARRPASFLLQEITRSVKLVYREATLSQPLAQVDKYLRVTNFYVKLLGMLATKFKHHNFPCVTEYFEALQLVDGTPAYLKDTQFSALVQRYVSSGMNEVMQLVYKHQIVEEAVLCGLNESKGVDAFNMLKYLHVCVATRDCEYLTGHIDLYQRIFEALLKVAANFVEADRYNAIIEYYAALMILEESRKLKVFFMTKVLCNEYLQAFASMQILMTAMSSSLFPADELLHDFRFWRRCNDKFALCTQNPKQLLVARLLRHALRQCTARPTIAKSDLWDEYAPNQLVERSYRFYMSVGLSEGEDLWPATLSADLCECVQRFEKGSSVENYYKTVVLVKLLASAKRLPTTEELEQSLELFTLIQRKATQFSLLSEACLNVAAKHVAMISETSLKTLLHQLRENLRHLRVAGVNRLLQVCLTAGKGLQIQDLARKIQDELSNHNVGLMEALNSKGSVQLSQEEDLSVYSSVHKCSAKSLHRTQAMKRQRFDEGEVETSTKRILHDILEKTHELGALSNQIDGEDVALIKDIVAALSMHTG